VATPGLVKIGADGDSGSPPPDGIGWRGPDSTCPGREDGIGLATGGIGRPGAVPAGAGAGVGVKRGSAGADGCAGA
jgi:hypothetical protein